VYPSTCTRRAGLGLLAALSLALVPPASFADDATESESRGVSVGATFSGPTSDPDGCLYADVDLFASETATAQGAEPPTESREIVTFVRLYEVAAAPMCENREIVSLFTPFPNENFDIEASANDKTARLIGRIAVCAAACKALDIDLTFTCVGPADRAKSKFEFGETSGKLKGTFCDAVAEGTVYEGEDFEADLVTTPSLTAEIGTNLAKIETSP
jgi:hypothetical protein